MFRFGCFCAAALIAAVGRGQPPAPVSVVNFSDNNPVRLVQSERLPLPVADIEPRSLSDTQQRESRIDPEQLKEIVRTLRTINQTGDRATVPTRTLNGISGVQYAAPCDGDDCEALRSALSNQVLTVCDGCRIV